MLRTQIYIPEELITHLKNVAETEQISVSELIRRSLKKTLRLNKKKSDPMKVFVGKGKSKKQTNAVKEINSYYQRSTIIK